MWSWNFSFPFFLRVIVFKFLSLVVFFFIIRGFMVNLLFNYHSLDTILLFPSSNMRIKCLHEIVLFHKTMYHRSKHSTIRGNNAWRTWQVFKFTLPDTFYRAFLYITAICFSMLGTHILNQFDKNRMWWFIIHLYHLFHKFSTIIYSFAAHC